MLNSFGSSARDKSNKNDSKPASPGHTLNGEWLFRTPNQELVDMVLNNGTPNTGFFFCKKHKDKSPPFISKAHGSYEGQRKAPPSPKLFF